MKTPWYETSAGATAVLLEAGSFVDVDCYSFTLAGEILGGGTLRYSAGAVDVATPGFGWPAAQVTFDQDKQKARGHWKVGLDVDTWQVIAAPRNRDILTGAADPDRIGGVAWLEAVRAGALDGAEVQVDRAFAPAWPAPGAALAPTGMVTIFYGRVAELDAGRSQAVITIASHLKLLTAAMPQRLYQAGCIHTLFDIGCALNASSYAMTGSVAALGATGNLFYATLGAPGGSQTYALGQVVMNTGNSQGFSRLVRSWTPPAGGSPGRFTLIAPFTLGIAVGDQFTAYPGCDKQFSTCGKFGNLANFGGELSIPAPETAA